MTVVLETEVEKAASRQRRLDRSDPRADCSPALRGSGAVQRDGADTEYRSEVHDAGVDAHDCEARREERGGLRKCHVASDASSLDTGASEGFAQVFGSSCVRRRPGDYDRAMALEERAEPHPPVEGPLLVVALESAGPWVEHDER